MNPRILIVEDIEENTDYLTQLLEDDYELIFARDGQEGLTIALAEIPSLILLDMSLPKKSGWEVARELRAVESTQGIPIIAVTAHAMQGDETKVRRVGCSDYVSKPIDEDVLLEKIRYHLDQKKTVAQSESAPQILVADESKSTELLTEELGEAGYQVIAANTGERALQLAAQLGEGLDLILLDVGLPDIDGFEVFRRFKEIPSISETPVIFLTMSRDSFQRLKGLRLGGFDFINKPYHSSELLARVGTLLKLKRLQDHLKELASVDELTGLYNRRYFFRRLHEVFESARRRQSPISCIMLDVDHFKRVNDTYGHLVGDLVLKLVGKTARDATRQVDVVARFGGEEFVVLLPDTGGEQSVAVAERLRLQVGQRKITHETLTVSVTISLGVSSVPVETSGMPELLIKRADDALYQAKTGGRNRVVAALQAAGEAGPPCSQ